jgi:tRNA (guanine-N7-)-methyltransferase
LEKYLRLLKPDGIIHLKTDSEPFFDYSMEQFRAYGLPVLAETKKLYESEWYDDHFGIKTRFEKIWYDKGYSINYARIQNKKEA